MQNCRYREPLKQQQDLCMVQFGRKMHMTSGGLPLKKISIPGTSKAPNPASAFRVGTTTLYRVLTSSSTSEGGSHLPDRHRWQRRCNWCFHWDTFSFYFTMWPRRWEREKGLYLELYLHHWNTSSPSTFLPAARIHCQQPF